MISATVWVVLGHDQFGNAPMAGGGSLAWAYGLAMATYVGGCGLIGFRVGSVGFGCAFVAGLGLAVFMELSGDGSGQSLSNYSIGIIGNAMVFLVPGLSAVLIGVLVGRRRRLPPPPL